jgi:hypothetical protein
LDEKKKGAPYSIFFGHAIFQPNTTEAKIDTLLESQFAAGRLYAAIASRPGQSGRADGYVLEGKELEVPFFVVDSSTVVEQFHHSST